MRWRSCVFLSVVLALSFAGGRVAAEEHSPAILARVAAWGRLHGDVQRNVRIYGVENVVVAVDFDNTTARVPTYVGSDAWYKAQIATGKDREAIHQELDHIFATTPHELIDPVTPEYVRKWQAMGVRVVLLTARSPRFHDVTRIEAERLGLNFRATAPSSSWDGKEVMLDYRGKAGAKRTGRVTYQSGMIHCGDVDKGTVLRAFLEAADLVPRAVVFADDRLHHLAEVGTAFHGSPIDLRLIHVDDGREPVSCATALAAN